MNTSNHETFMRVFEDICVKHPDADKYTVAITQCEFTDEEYFAFFEQKETGGEIGRKIMAGFKKNYTWSTDANLHRVHGA